MHTKQELDTLKLEHARLKATCMEQQLKNGTRRRTRRGICKIGDKVKPIDLLGASPAAREDILNKIASNMDDAFYDRLTDELAKVNCLVCHGSGVKSPLSECATCRGTGVHLTCKRCGGTVRPGWIWTGMDNMKWIPCSECNPDMRGTLYPKKEPREPF